MVSEVAEIAQSQFRPEDGANPERNYETDKPLLLTFDFHGAFTDDEKERFAFVQKRDLEKIAVYLQTDRSFLAGMRYKVFSTRESKQEADPQHSISRASARFKEFAIYRYWQPEDDPSFPHEMTHLVAHRWAVPYQFTTQLDTADGNVITQTLDMVSTSFMQEGLAIAVDDILFQRMLTEGQVTKTVDTFCRDQRDAMPTSLQSVINFAGFGSLPNEVVVPFSASLSKFLLAKYGLETYKKLYTAVKEVHASEENIAIIEATLHTSEQDLLHEWRRSIGLDK